MEVTIQAYREENREDIERMEWEAAFVKADILDNLEEFAACGMVATIQNEVVGIGVFTGESKKVSVSLYIEPAKRQQGIGRKLLKALEGHMREVGVKAVVVDFKVDEGIHSFWIKEGYKDWFKSQFMLREGENTVLESCDIRPYEDRDYPECQKISSVAFHEMRTLAGLESKAAEPSETGRRACEERRNEIFVMRDKGIIVGWYILSKDEIDGVSVDVAKHRHGYGRIMVGHAINILHTRGYRKISLWCLEKNPAKYLYEKMGFEIVRTHQFMEKHIEK